VATDELGRSSGMLRNATFISNSSYVKRERKRVRRIDAGAGKTTAVAGQLLTSFVSYRQAHRH
jgi:hypothetical protein